ncbi:MAG: hypothetical protein HRT89_19680 [Lentisphaeria bacterium]|nr:hypothetical protein [Lentisphaeria bacterium]NQZ70278.1 hypothetical protein [Lentisphaeria bacterium]
MNRTIHKLVLFSIPFFSSTICAASGPTASDSKIGHYAAIFGTNRLAKDPTDKTGHLLIKLAHQIKPDNDLLLLTQYYIEKNKAIKPVKTTYTSLEFSGLLSKRANSLLKELSMNRKVGPLALVYLQTAEIFNPTSKSIIYKITKLVSYDFMTELGFTNDRVKNLSVGLNFPGLFKDAEPLKVNPGLKLSTSEKKIVIAAIALGTNRLVKNAGDEMGLTWIRLVGFLKPDDKQYLLTVGLLMRNQKLSPLKLTMSEGELIKLMLARADSLVAKSKSQIRKQEALLFYKVALLINSDSKKAVIGEMKLKMKGIEGSLEALLNQNMNSTSFKTTASKKQKKSLTVVCPYNLKKHKAELDRGKTATLGANCDDEFILYVNDKKMLVGKWEEVPTRQVLLKPGDIITVKAIDHKGEYGLSVIFGDKDHHYFSSNSDSWWEYKPWAKSNWWNTKGLRKSHLKDTRNAPEQGWKELLEKEMGAKCKEAIWGAGKEKSTVYLIKVVQYQDLIDNTAKK